MNTVRRHEQERRVAPIDAGQRPRVRPGGRREPTEIEERPARREDGSFAGELARQEEGGASRPAEDEHAPSTPVDRVEIHGLTVPVEPPSGPDVTPHLDLKV